MQMKRRGREMRLIIDDTGPARTDYTMIKTIGFAREWFQDLLSGRAKNIAEIASREGVDRSDINRRLSLAFLSPEILDAIAAGKQPVDLNVEKLIRRVDLPLAWSEQKRLLHFFEPQTGTPKCPTEKSGLNRVIFTDNRFSASTFA
jgi:hypothetical protein